MRAKLHNKRTGLRRHDLTTMDLDRQTQSSITATGLKVHPDHRHRTSEVSRASKTNSRAAEPVCHNLAPTVRAARTSQLQDSGDRKDLEDSLQFVNRTSLLQDSEDIRGMNRSHNSMPELLVRKAGCRDKGNILGWRNEEQQTSNYWISEREKEDDRSSDDMEKVYSDRHSSVNKGTEQGYSELTGEEMEPVHLWERHTKEVVELNLKAGTPSRRTEIQQDKIECRLGGGTSTDIGQIRIAIPDEKDADKRTWMNVGCL